MARTTIRFVHNGRVVELGGFPPTRTLLDWLREEQGLTGTKEGCAEGDCGACTVVLGHLAPGGGLRLQPVNACILLLGMIDGAWLVTVEDLAGPDGVLHPVQRAMVDLHGSQCGFCTPGFVMTMLAMLDDGAVRTPEDADPWLAGNLCRCTGYGPIREAAVAAGTRQPPWFAERAARAAALLAGLGPAEDIEIASPGGRFVAPADSGALAHHLAAHPEARIVAGATDLGLWITKQLRGLPHLVDARAARDLRTVRVEADRIEIGGSATYAEALPALLADFPEAAVMFERLGGVQVRAAATMGGNIANGSPIGDSPPLLIALGARLRLRLGDERRTIPLEAFFLAYGRQDRRPGEFVEAIEVPRRDPDLHVAAYKVSKRRDQDISAVLAAFAVRLDADGVVRAARLAYGGMAGVPALAPEAAACLLGRRWGPEAVAQAKAALARDFSPIDDHRASAWYRRTVAANLLDRFLDETLAPPSAAPAARVAGTMRRA